MRSPGEQKESEFGAGWKFLIVSSFVMLSMLTWAVSPLAKLVEKVQHKETVKAQLKVCKQVRAMIPVYEDWVIRLWKSGCFWENYNIIATLEPDRAEDVRKQLDEGEGLDFERMDNRCGQAAASAIQSNKVVDKVATPIYFNELDCPKLYEEAKKLGIEDKDVQ